MVCVGVWVKTIFETEPLNYNSALCITFYLPCRFRIKHNRNFLPQLNAYDYLIWLRIYYMITEVLYYILLLLNHIHTIFYIYAALQKKKKKKKKRRRKKRKKKSILLV